MAKNDISFTMSHKFDAPVERVFEAWTKVKHLKRWLPPKGYSMICAKKSIKPGGMCHYCMVSKSGMEIWGKMFYKDIIPPAKVSYTQCFSNEKGGIERHPMIKTWPLEIFTTVMLDEKKGRTILKLTWKPLNASIDEINKFSAGVFDLNQEWGGTLEQLEKYLAKG